MAIHKGRFQWYNLASNEDPYADIELISESYPGATAQELTKISIVVTNRAWARIHVEITATLEPEVRGPIARDDRDAEGFVWPIKTNISIGRIVPFPRELKNPVSTHIQDGELTVVASVWLEKGGGGRVHEGDGFVVVP